MRLERNDIAALICFALAGMFNAFMDYNLWERWLGHGWMTNFFDSLGLKAWFLAEGGNERWQHLWLIWDAWHLAKNLMWFSIGAGVAFIARDWRWAFSAIVITTSFIIFYQLFRAQM